MNRKLLYFNLAIDSKDTSLGFAIKWIETISNNYDQVDVVTLRLSTNPNFSNNVNVYGPKKQDKKIYKYYYFFKQVKFLTSNNVDPIPVADPTSKSTNKPIPVSVVAPIPSLETPITGRFS